MSVTDNLFGMYYKQEVSMINLQNNLLFVIYAGDVLAVSLHVTTTLY